ncbi:hypothetical protein [Calothrix sp. PCC 6303]|uniref:hypothetical protein n=1 Tax=Calothrix sp. PCC 6303 TaxID=1170562 RepID=UPI0002A013A5|nr:hypothetical protein [Calothrix sp. PCC 6303]AFZ03816.1 hypothetical protein Cal6303_4919 [Calothrix sp. PCC 6303]
MIIYFLNITEGIWRKFRSSTNAMIEQSQQVGLLLQESINQATNQSLENFIQKYPLISKLLQFLTWISNHPLLGILLILFILILMTSLVRAFVRLIESISLSLLRSPLKWTWLLAQYIFKSISIFFEQIINKNSDKSLIQEAILESQNLEQTRQQRLIEISQKLTRLQIEQGELLEEASKLLNQFKVDN